MFCKLCFVSKFFIALSFVLIFSNLNSYSQDIKPVITGKVVDDRSQPMKGATVSVSPAKDSTKKTGDVTDREGNFKIEIPGTGDYKLEISYIGFKKFLKIINLNSENKNLGTLKLTEADINLGEITVEGQMMRQEQNKDTTIFNANAFKVNPDATTEDLVKKMPGVTVESDGTVKAHGEDIKRVLVDGKEFFGEDPSMALKNLPAEVIDKIQVYDRASDQAQFTGFDDGNAQKTLNIITKSDKNKGNFGKLYAGYGTQDRFWAGGNVNYFAGDRRISVIALSNNINQQNFAIQDVLSATGASAPRGPGGMGRPQGGGAGGGGFRGMMGGAGDFFVGQSNGISTTNSIGINYSDVWSTSVTFTGSYFLNITNNDNKSVISRNFFTQNDLSQIYNENNISGSDNYNHRFNGRLEYKIDSSNSFLIRPRLNMQTNKLNSSVDGSTAINSDILNNTLNNYKSDLTALNFENSVLYKLKFPAPGRTLSMEVETSVNKNNGNTLLNSTNTVYNDTNNNIIELKQDGDIFGDGYKIGTELSYTEPVTENGMLQFTYNPAYTLSNSDKKYYDITSPEIYPGILDTTLSNNYENTYIQQRGGLSYNYHNDLSNFSVGVDYQSARLEGKQLFPSSKITTFNFNNFLPNLRYQYNFSKTVNLRFNYRTSTNAPSVSQLQDVIDNSNPVILKTGNPDLKQTFTHTLMTRLGAADPHASSSIFGFAMLRFSENYIANSTFTARRDTTLNNISLNAGSQLIRPVNLDGYIMGRSFLAYGIPVQMLKSNFNINAGFSYSRTPGMIDNVQNLANNYTVNSGVVIASNISPEIDFTIAYNANYSIIKNSILPSQDNNYFISVANVKFNWIFWDGFLINTEVFHNMYSGLGQDYNQEFLLWNASIGYKFLDKNAAEVRLSVYDILGQNNSISRNVTEIYVEDQQTQVLQRYFMLTFTYNLRMFGS